MDIERSVQRAKSLLMPWPGILELASGSVEKMRASLLPIAPQQRGSRTQLRVLVLCALPRAMPKSKSKILFSTDRPVLFDAQAEDLG